MQNYSHHQIQDSWFSVCYMFSRIITFIRVLIFFLCVRLIVYIYWFMMNHKILIVKHGCHFYLTTKSVKIRKVSTLLRQIDGVCIIVLKVTTVEYIPLPTVLFHNVTKSMAHHHVTTILVKYTTMVLTLGHDSAKRNIVYSIKWPWLSYHWSGISDNEVHKNVNTWKATRMLI